MKLLQRTSVFFRNVADMSRASFRSIGLKNIDAWREMFPNMFLDADTSVPALSERAAQKLSVVFTCLNVLGETYGSLPCDVKQSTPNGVITLNDDPVHRLVHDRPNPYTTAFDFWSTMVKLRKAYGNAYAYKQYDSYNNIVALWLLKPWEISIRKSEDGELYYQSTTGRKFSFTELLHWKNYSLDGIEGLSSIKENALTIGMARKLKTYNSSLIGKRPYGYLTAPTRPKDLEQKEAMKGQWTGEGKEKNGSKTYKSEMMGDIPLLYGGLEFKALTLPADDVQYIGSNAITDREIYGIFRMPPTMAQDWEKAPYNSSEQQDIVFAKYTLADIRGVEQECNEKLFPESNKTAKNKKYIKFNLQGLLRGDSTTRALLYNKLFLMGALSPKKIAELEDLPTEGVSDKFYMQGAMVPVDLLADFVRSKGTTQVQNDPEQTRSEIIEEIREKIRSRLNGHYKDVADILEP